MRVSYFSTSPATLVVCCLFFNIHSDWCDVIHHFGFGLISLNDKWCWASFHVPAGHLYISFGKMSHILIVFLNIKLYEFFVLIYLGYLPNIRYIICKYFLPFSRQPFCFADCFLHCAKSFLVWCSPVCLFLLLFSLRSIWDFSYFLRLTFVAINFLRIAFAASHRFWNVVFSFLYVWKQFLKFPLTSSLTNWLLSSMFFRLHMFTVFCFGFFFLDSYLLISSLILLWLKKVLDMTSVFSISLKFQS